jgi:hypothetical protein
VVNCSYFSNVQLFGVITNGPFFFLPTLRVVAFLLDVPVLESTFILFLASYMHSALTGLCIHARKLLIYALLRKIFYVVYCFVF